METFPLLLQFILSGIAIGSIYGLIALGYIFIYRSSGVVNLAQGDFVMIGGFLTLLLTNLLGLPTFIAAVLAILVSFVLGYFIDVVALRPIESSSLLNKVMVTLGVSFILTSIMGLAFGVEYERLDGLSGGVTIFGATLSYQSLFIILMLIVVALVMWIILQKTKSGAIFRAVSDDPYAVKIIGYNPIRTRSIAFGISGALGALAGVLAAPIVGLSFDQGISLAVIGFIAAVIGGFGRPFGGLSAGIAIGIIQTMTSGFISGSLRNLVTYLLLFLILMLRPSGFLGESKTGNSSL